MDENTAWPIQDGFHFKIVASHKQHDAMAGVMMQLRDYELSTSSEGEEEFGLVQSKANRQVIKLCVSYNQKVPKALKECKLPPFMLPTILSCSLCP